MNRSRSSSRASVRSSNFETSRRGMARASDAGLLAARAGSARATIEPLENRQLLFSLTITQPGEVVQAFFGYQIPFLGVDPDDIDEVDPPDPVIEDFNDADLDADGDSPDVGPIASGQVFPDSNIVVNHTILPVGDFRLELVPGSDDEARVFTRMDVGENVRFRFAADENNTDTFVGVGSFSMTVAPGPNSAVGLPIFDAGGDPNAVVELLFQGEIIETFTGQDLADASNTGTGVGTFTFTPVAGNPTQIFDEVRISVTSGPNDPFFIDDLVYQPLQGRFADLIDRRAFGAQLVFSGPVGASVEVLDLYGRDMIQTLALGVPDGLSNVALADLDDDGVPDFNDGLGSITLRGTDQTARLQIWGGEIEPNGGQPADDADFSQGGFDFFNASSIMGLFDEFEDEGFGYILNNTDGEFEIEGLPPGPGSVILGSPFVRDNSSAAAYDPTGFVDVFVDSGFNRVDQGIFVLDGADMGAVSFHGVAHGSSVFTGAVNEINIGYLVGSLTVNGDAGVITVASDAGLWVPDPGFNDPGFEFDTVVVTDAQIVVGRTAREIAIAGRSSIDVTVVGDLNDSQAKPPLDVFRFTERERVYSIDPANVQVEEMLDSHAAGVLAEATATGQALPAHVFGNGFFRNDSILSAEFVGSAATAVEITGELGLIDPVNAAEDAADVYAFAADGSTPIVVEALGRSNIRILDHRGRTVAAAEDQLLDSNLSVADTLVNFQRVEYMPDMAGTYYVTISTAAIVDGDFATGSPYTLTISGLAPVSLGQYRTGANNGPTADAEDVNAITVLSGNVGSVRVGTAYMGSQGGEQDPSEVFNTDVDDEDTRLDFRGGSFTITGGSLFNITTGSDLGDNTFENAVNFVIGGDLGVVVTGLSQQVGLDPFEGDLGAVNLQVGGSIEFLDILGGIGISQDVDDPELPAILPPDSVNITAGAGLDGGGIGFIRAGSHMGGLAVNIATSDNAGLGGLLLSQDVAFDPASTLIGILSEPPTITTGAGSDVRFVDFPQVDFGGNADQDIPILGGDIVELTDDAGGSVQISIANAPDGLQAGLIRVIPIDGSQGVAIGQIVVDLTGGRRLDITSLGSPTNTDVISIGRIDIVGADANSSVVIDGPAQVDVWQIIQTGGAALDGIANRTPFGDLVAVDVVGINDLDIEDGDLGLTQTPFGGPEMIGPFVGLGGGGRAIPVAADVITPDWNGGLYRPINDANYDSGNTYLDDLGAPADPFLNGLISRGGTIQNVRVGGAVGDVIAVGDINLVTANFDNVTPFGEFDGIVGSIYANSIGTVEIGDGVARRGSSPLASSGIFANDFIQLVTGELITGASIFAPIMAGDNGTGLLDNPDLIDTVGAIRLEGGSLADSFVGGVNIDQWWRSPLAAESGFFTGGVDEIRIDGGGDLFRTTINAFDAQDIVIADGFFDASFMEIGGSVERIEAKGFRNSTLTGSDREFRSNVIRVGNNVAEIRAIGTPPVGGVVVDDPVGIGDIIDLEIEVLGSVTGSITANNFTRAQINVANQIQLLTANDNIRSSDIVAGRVQNLSAGRNIRTSTISVSGPIINLTATDNITNTDIAVTGPDGRIETITTQFLLSGTISASGPIQTVRVTDGDMIATITTTTDEGDVNLLEASRDLIIQTDISGQLGGLVAGRNIGDQNNPGVILIRDNLDSVSAGGQLYSDLRVGENVTGTVSVSQVVNKVGNVQVGNGSIIAFGSINRVTATGDFGGSVVSFSGGINTVQIIDGSFLPGRKIEAQDGSIGLVEIQRGHLLGDVMADVNIDTIRITSNNDTFGDIGVNPALSNGVFFDEFRNELPPGVFASAAIDGPRIVAGEKISLINVRDGGVYEAFIHAGTFLANLTVAEDVGSDGQTIGTSTVIAAGNKLNFVDIGGDVKGTIFLGGATDFGVDGTLGGTGLDADRVKRGFIRQIFIDGSIENVDFAAGLIAGPDGVFNTADDVVEFGKSRINTIQVGGSVTDAKAFSDAFVNSGDNITNGIALKGTNRPVNDPQIAPGIPAGAAIIPMDGSPFDFSFAGGSGTITFVDPSAAPVTNAYWDASTGTVTLIKTSKNAELIVNSDSGVLSGFDVVSNDDASVGLIQINADLTDGSDIVIDNKLRNLIIGDFLGGGRIRVGGDLLNFTSGSFLEGELVGHYTRNFVINGDFGSADDPTAAQIDLISAENITVNGAFSGGLDIERYLGLFQDGQLTVNGEMNRGVLRVGASAGNIAMEAMDRSRITVNDALGDVTIDGSMNESSIVAGGDLGTDLAFDKISSPDEGPTVDRTTTGSIESVSIGGSAVRSDIVAGIMRGFDGFFGTADDTVADGRSTIGSIDVAGEIVGSNLNSQSYLFGATGEFGTVNAGGQVASGEIGNVDIERLETLPLPIEVEDLRVLQDALIYTAQIVFNQAMNANSISDALTVSEVRNGGLVSLTLVEGLDYAIEYDADNFTASIIFSQSITSRDLPQLADKPGPGVYRFSLDSSLLRAQVVGARLDADGDGFATGGEVLSIDDIVGDPGDKLDSEVLTINDFLGNPTTVDLYGAVDLDLVLDSNTAPDGLPDVNQEFTLRGFLGDHPDHSVTSFSFSSDVDIYKITLQAGQILRLGPQSGGAQFAARALLDADGDALAATVRQDAGTLFDFLDETLYSELPIAEAAGPVLVQRGTISDQVIRLPDTPLVEQNLTTEDQFLIKESGVYFLVVSNTDDITPGQIVNIPPVPGGVGDYAFTVEVFDDGDSGFNGDTNAGDGAPVVTAPLPITFAGPDGQFNTNDDRATVQVGTFVFTLDEGGDGVPNTEDDLVSGSNGKGIVSQRMGDGTLQSFVQSSIGPALSSGVPSNVTSDIDVFHLNGQQPVQPGTQMRLTVRLTELGSDLGSRTQGSLQVFDGAVQFSLFDTTDATAMDDATLLFSPSDFAPTGQIPGILADNGSTRYGYDDQGDFFIEFLTPGRLGADGLQPATYAVAVQGAFNADYSLEIVTQPGTQPVVTEPQNIFIETGGGTVDWLEVAGQTTILEPYTTSVVGFNGKINGQSVDQVVLNDVVQGLQNAFTAAGVPVNISTNVADFEFEDFSTVFLTKAGDPLNFFNDRLYGVAEHSDPLNADLNDEAVVFVPTLGILGLTPSEADVDQFGESLTAAVGRRVGELLGLRLHVPTGSLDGGQSFPIQASNSPELFGLPFRFNDANLPLSTQFDTELDSAFFLGEHNSASLLDKIFAQ